MNDFEMIKNSNLVTTRQEIYPSFADGVTLTAAGANVEGSQAEICPVATNTVNTWTITHAADASGSIIVTLDGVPYTTAITAGTIAEVAIQMRAATYGDWVVTGTGNDVIFTKSGRNITSTFFDVGTVTKVTATIVSTNAGVGIGKNFQITAVSPNTLSAIGTYTLTLYSGLANNTRRIASAKFSIATAVGLIPMIPIKTTMLPAGTRVTGTLTSLAGGSETMKATLQYDA